MKISLIPLLVGGIANLFLAVAIYFMVKKLTAKSLHPKRWAWLAVVAWYVIPLPFIWWMLYVLPLPSDEYMTEHFHKHRHEFDSMVKAYRESYLLENPLAEWDDSAEMEEIKRKANVWRLTSISGMEWHENPYSLEAAQDFDRRRSMGLVDTAKNRSRKGVIVKLNNGQAISFSEGAQVSKNYLHIPLIPRIEDGKLLYPIHASKSAEQRFLALKDSLDNYPDNWENGECFVKPLDTQWFIELCKAY